MLNFRSKFSWLVIILFMKTTSPIVRLSNTALRILQTSNHLIEGVSVSQLLITMLDAAPCSCPPTSFPPPYPPSPPLAFEIERLWEWLCHLETREPIARWEEGTTRNVSKKAEGRGCWKDPKYKTKYQKRGFVVVCAEVWRGKKKALKSKSRHSFCLGDRFLAKTKQTLWLRRADERYQSEDRGGYDISGNKLSPQVLYLGGHLSECRMGLGLVFSQYSIDLYGSLCCCLLTEKHLCSPQQRYLTLQPCYALGSTVHWCQKKSVCSQRRECN